MVKMKTYKIPDIKEILKPRWAHKPGFGMSEGYVLHRRKGTEQSTAPEDRSLLKKLGIAKQERVLAIAGYYASWASEIARAGAKVDYSDISRSLVNWVRKKYGRLFGEYICSNYELIPKTTGEYDWTFTYEACGGNSGLPIAYLRSLLNRKGGILVLCLEKDSPKNMGSKLRTYPGMVKKLSEIYSTRSSVRKVRMQGHRLGRETKILPFIISTIRTNQRARELALEDLTALTTGKFARENLERLSRLSEIINEEYLKEVRIR